MNHTRRHAVGLALTAIGAAASAQGTVPADAKKAVQLDPVEVNGHYDNSVGSSDAASAGVITPQLIEDRPLLRPGQPARIRARAWSSRSTAATARPTSISCAASTSTTAPTSRPGSTACRSTCARTPTARATPTSTSSSRSWSRASTTGRARTTPNIGDFGSAGGANMHYFDSLKQGIALGHAAATTATGARCSPARRALGAGTLTYGLELLHNDGPWEVPDNFRKVNGVLRYVDAGRATASSASRRWPTAASGTRPTRSRSARSTPA